jgi:hypothetical protein
MLSSYLWTPSEVERESRRILGDFRGMAWDWMKSQLGADEKHVITFKFKPGHPMGLKEYVYSCIESEWRVFQNEIDTYCSEEPVVHVVDSKWKIPI